MENNISAEMSSMQSGFTVLTWKGIKSGKTLKSSNPAIDGNISFEYKDYNLGITLEFQNIDKSNLELKYLQLFVDYPKSNQVKIGLVDFTPNLIIHQDTIKNKIHNYEKMFTYDKLIEILELVTSTSRDEICNILTEDRFDEISEFIFGLSSLSKYAEYVPAVYIRPFSLLAEIFNRPVQEPALETIMFDPVAFQTSSIELDKSFSIDLVKWEYNPIWTTSDEIEIDEYAAKYQWKTNLFEKKTDKMILSTLLESNLSPKQKQSLNFQLPMLNELSSENQIEFTLSLGLFINYSSNGTNGKEDILATSK